MRDAATFAFTHHLTVVLDARRRRCKNKSVLLVEVRIENDCEVVAAGEQYVAHFLTGNNAVRVAIIHPRADVQRFAIREHAHFGTLSHGLTFTRLTLHEAAEQFTFAPHRFVELSVNHRRGCDDMRFATARTHRRGACRCCCHRLRDQRVGQQHRRRAAQRQCNCQSMSHYFGHPDCGNIGVNFSAFWKYTFFSTLSGRSMP